MANCWLREIITSAVGIWVSFVAKFLVHSITRILKVMDFVGSKVEIIWR